MEQPARSTKKTHLPGTPSPGGYHWPPEEGPRSGSSTPGDKTSFTGALLAGESSTPGWPVSIPNPKGLTPLQCLVAGPPSEVGNCQIDAAACPRSGAPRRGAGHVLIGPVCPPRRNAARPAEGTGRNYRGHTLCATLLPEHSQTLYLAGSRVRASGPPRSEN